MASGSSRFVWASACAVKRIADRMAVMGFTHGGTRAYSAGTNSTALIKQLRERTGARMKDVKAVLQQCDWDPEAAFTELRKKGLAAASKKASRVAADGLLGVAQEAKSAAVVEINSETDFVARNDLFQHLVSQVAKAALAVESSSQSHVEAAKINMEALEAAKIELSHPKLKGESTVSEAVAEVASIMGENVKLRRGFHMSTTSGIVSSYLHSTSQPGLARILGLVTLEPQEEIPTSEFTGHDTELMELGSTIAMHVVAMRPLFLSKDLVDAAALQHERDILTTQALASGKPAKVVEKIVEGRLRKYVEEVVLLQQKYVLDDTKTVQGRKELRRRGGSSASRLDGRSTVWPSSSTQLFFSPSKHTITRPNKRFDPTLGNPTFIFNPPLSYVRLQGLDQRLSAGQRSISLM